MKKIIATVLAMVMALALCSTAFAATTVTAKAYRYTDATKAVKEEMVATFNAAKTVKLNSDGEQDGIANVAYYTVTAYDVTDDSDYVVVSSLAEADLVLYGDKNATSVMLYLAKAEAHYNGSGTVFTNFGDKCGQLDYDYDKTKTYYTTNAKGDDALYVADAAGTKSLMVGGKLVSVKATPVVADATATVKHTAIPTVKDGKVVGYTCSNCKCTAVKAANVASIPSDAQRISDTLWYFPAAAASTTTSNSSPKTFDAGIAMYVGMALTSVAGSAVVIGKKKEF